MPEVILPALNEAAAIPWVLERMPSGYLPLVVDNCSTDGTGEVAAGLGARVVREPQPGFGAACWAGLQAAGEGIVCFMDCDGSLDPQDLPKVVDLLEAGARLGMGARRAVPGAWPWHARLANRLIALELRRRCGLRLTDLGPMRAARREDLMSLQLADRRYGWPLEMVLKAAAAGWPVSEVAVDYLPRKGGRSKVSGSVKGSLRAIADMGSLLR